MGSPLPSLAFLLLFASSVCGSNICTSRGVTTCRECLFVHPSCAWCSQEVFGMGRSSLSRCDFKENLIKEGCSEAAIEFPSSFLKITKNDPLSDKSSNPADVTQIRPQKLHMTLRLGTLVHKDNANDPHCTAFTFLCLCLNLKSFPPLFFSPQVTPNVSL
uniref:Integrin beta 3a n=1 Tax=Fundulus heteroclitus TaxID=8078 RepID=A0A3Q2PFB3_FUNHE